MAELVISINTDSASTPSAGAVSLYPKADSRFYMKDSEGAEVRLLTDEVTITTLSVAAPLQSTNGNNPIISISNATATASGAMPSSDKAKLDNATSSNTPNTLLARDGLGNVSAGTFTGTLAGTATTCQTLPSLSGHITTTGSTNQTTIQSGVISNNMIANNANIDLAKLSINPLDRSNHTGSQPTSSITGFQTALDEYLANAGAGRISNAHIVNNAAIALSKLAVNPLTRSLHTGTQATSTIENFDGAVQAIVTTAVATLTINNTNIAANAGISLNKLATNPLDRANHTGAQASSTISDFAAGVNAAVSLGNGLTKTAGQLTVQGTTNRIISTSTGVDISTDYIGQNSITTLGVITSGSWQASIIDIAQGGTGSANPIEAANNLRVIQTLNGVQALTRTLQEYVLADTSLGNATFTLPPASSGVCYFLIKKSSNDANTVIINAASSNTIEGVTSKTLTTQYQYIALVNNNTTWYVIGQS